LDNLTVNKGTGIFKWVPGLLLFKGYQKGWLPSDIAAGLSVASIALPIGLAYAGIAGLPPEVGLYSTILPMVAYAMFGSSRQLIVGPDSATCMLVAASITVYTASGPAKYASMSILLSLMVGAICVLAGIFRLGFIVNFLSKPILTGYLNGMAISIIVGQLGKLFGFKLIQGGFIKQMGDFFSKLNETHLLTLLIGVTTFFFLRISKKFIPKVPAPLITVAAGICLIYFFGLQNSGVVLVGIIPAGLPPLGLEPFTFGEMQELLGSSLSIVLICYCSAMLTSKSFAVRNGYDLNPNQDFIALGLANLFSGFSHGFVISGADSRTAVSDTMGGKTQLTSVFASLTLVLFLVFFTFPLAMLPITVLSAIIISASIGLFNLGYLKRIYKVSKREFALATFTSLCVITIGVLPAVLIAVGLSLFRLIVRASNPRDEVLGKVEGIDSYQDISEFTNAQTVPGLLIYRFESGLLFFNADNMRNRIRSLVASSNTPVNTVMIDASTFLTTDLTGVETLGDLCTELKKQNISLCIARGKTEFMTVLEKSGIDELIGKNNFFSSVREGVEYYKKF
jgi:high affinity sulfate transporter 1